VPMGGLATIGLMLASGVALGASRTPRDVMLKDAAPHGQIGKVFGFVTTGFNIGGIVAPLMFGAIMDHGSPRLVFLTVAALSLVAILTVATRPRQPV